MATIKTWSYSRLGDFEACKYRAQLKYIDKIPEPPRPLPAGKSEHANERGSRIHDAAELYVRGGVELLEVLVPFKERYDELKTLFGEGRVQLEQEWAFDEQWGPAAWGGENAWLRMKLDAFVLVSDTQARVIDYKTGKKYGNEVKHAEQGQLYQLAAFVKYPELESIQVEFWYIDQGVDLDMRLSYTRQQGTAYHDKFHKRGIKITSATDFPPNPNAYSCKWCPYLNGACKFGVSKEVIDKSKHNQKPFKRAGMAGLFK